MTKVLSIYLAVAGSPNSHSYSGAYDTLSNSFIHSYPYHRHFSGYKQEGRTALMYACMNGHGDIVKFLLEHGADPKAVDCVSLSIVSVVAVLCPSPLSSTTVS